MNNGRLFGIIYHLLNTKRTTSSELAELFEVSKRTIYRDLNALSSLGIPVYTESGRNGGVYLLDQFVLNNILLSKKEQENLLLALKGIESITPKISQEAYSKLQSLFKLPFDNWLEVDFSPWYREGKDTPFELLKSGILDKKQIEFEYIGSTNQCEKRICNPLKLVFKSQTWYLQAFCTNREDFRIFKINRMKSIRIRDESFEPIPIPKIAAPKMDSKHISLSLAFSKEILYRVFDEFDHADITVQPDGTAIVSIAMPDQNWLVHYLLSYGKHMRILSPDYLKLRLKHEMDEILSNYSIRD
ncbi:helix-turn-helix transcriptional regulator [Listeria kieliensis]|uniref:Transcriptional regulator n=1 Tax=Listeria kieliensis TaxID=1621700 RepID=A0A3D8TSU4_9LIST|nr:YafY family protein [Listeria kieliensis]RDX02010.1 transcriptional regulator [Listeria kieliensis]